MRIFPLILITIGVFGVLKHLGYIDPALLHLLWPVLFIVVGVALLMRGPRWRADMHDRMHDRWERRMQRHHGPGWNNLSEEERERFRAGMRHGRSRCGGDGDASAPASARGEASPPFPAQPPAPVEPR